MITYTLTASGHARKRTDLLEKVENLPRMWFPECTSDHGLYQGKIATRYYLPTGQMVAIIVRSAYK
jgi:hypothetical protein